MNETATADRSATAERLQQVIDASATEPQMLMPIDVEPDPQQHEQPRSVGRSSTSSADKNSTAYAFMQTSDELDKLLPALIAATAHFDDVDFDKKGKIKPKDPTKSGYEYEYASLRAVMDAVRQPLRENGLLLMHAARVVSQGNRVGLVVRTTLWHVSGQWIRTDLPVSIYGADPQNVGAGFSYAKRYNALGLLNLSPGDEDDDGQSNAAAAEEQHARDRQQSMPQPAKRQTAPQQQQPKPAPQPPPTAAAPQPPAQTAPDTTAAPQPIGTIKDVIDKNGGAFVVMLSTGFYAGSRDKAVRAMAESAKGTDKRFEIKYQPPSNPAYAMKLIELVAL